MIGFPNHYFGVGSDAVVQHAGYALVVRLRGSALETFTVKRSSSNLACFRGIATRLDIPMLLKAVAKET